MAAQVLSFFQRSPRHAPAPTLDWSQQELAEFYRVEAALIRAGIRVGTDRGLSDENEPWFVFYRTDDGEVVIHFARIDGEYLIAGPAYEEIARGFDFSAMVRNMVARHPLIRRSERGSNISVHPAALLVAVVGTAFFKTGEARAAESGAANPPTHTRPTLLTSSSNAGVGGGTAPVVAASAAQSNYDAVQLPANQAVLVLAAALFASDFTVDPASVSPSTQAALSAAAAALDFGGAAAPGAQIASESVLIAPHASAVVNTPAQTMSSVLSLVALLSTLPHVEDTAQAASLPLSLDAPQHVADAKPLAAPAQSDPANWSLEVRLGVGALPSVEAVQLVRAVVGEATQKISVIEVSKLPDILAELVAKSEHYVVAPAGAIAEPVTEAPKPPLPIDGGGETPPPPTGHEPPGPSDPTSPTAPATHFANPELVRDFINYFIAHTNGIEVVVHGQEIVMFDARVLVDPGAIGVLQAVAFDFADGGRIALVGGQDAFLNDGFLI